MNHDDEDAQNKLADAFTALNKAGNSHGEALRIAGPTLLATCSSHFGGIARGLTHAVDNAATAARRMNENTQNPTVGEAYDGVRATCAAAGRVARSLQRTLHDLQTMTWGAREVSAVKGSTGGLDIRDLLETVHMRLGEPRHVTTDPIVLAWTIHALMQITDRTASLLTATAVAAGRLSDQASTPVEATAHRDTRDKATQAARTANSLHRHLSTAATRAGDASARAVRKCPECGEVAVPQTPQDLTPSQRRAPRKPTWSHRDGTQLCPVVGRDGYEPAQPA